METRKEEKFDWDFLSHVSWEKKAAIETIAWLQRFWWSSVSNWGSSRDASWRRCCENGGLKVPGLLSWAPPTQLNTHSQVQSASLRFPEVPRMCSWQNRWCPRGSDQPSCLYCGIQGLWGCHWEQSELLLPHSGSGSMMWPAAKALSPASDTGHTRPQCSSSPRQPHTQLTVSVCWSHPQPGHGLRLWPTSQHQEISQRKGM